jgi:triacylglycerol lipase
MRAALALIGAEISAAGATIDPRATAKLYDGLHEREPYRDVTVTRDLSYGPHPRNLANVFVAGGQDPTPRPVLIFLHGGGYISGDRRMRAGSPYYDNVGLWAVRHGFVGVVITYRLAPDAPWPAAQHDIAAALGWARDHASRWGGDPDALLLMGHSAGASHIAFYLGCPEFASSGPSARGAILMSPTVATTRDDQVTPDDAPFIGHERQYFGEDPDHPAERDALPGLVACPVDLLVVSPRWDPPFFARHAARLRQAFDRAGRDDRFVDLPTHNHMSQLFALNTPDTALGEAILDFVAARLASGSHEETTA